MYSQLQVEKIMKELKIETTVQVCIPEELSLEEQELIAAADEATHRSYAPYSNFSVGAAVRLANGIIVTGNNQENAAYPSGLCAERTTLFYANAQYPDQAVLTLAIVARNSEGELLSTPISPCGACRQVMLETEIRFRHPIKILLCGAEKVYIVENVTALLPLSFGSEYLK